MKVDELKAKLIAKKDKEDAIKDKYIEKNKVEKLTDKKRIDRIEELLNIE
jgi:hypothetical protein